ncbi:hypothetical protein C3K47_05295 [Solitalea longa]|uniref:Uncharacterized protein n=1 Tax=Solitalea longa TaxID=2079460 RepID=A0A2S5A6K1_9SPHI|nr:hypothetical protein [Solitalea longa]POY37939.1 hypothetical protein C3K47_05295 [Solitalea longa]
METITIEVPKEIATVLNNVLNHYKWAKQKHPQFPNDIIHQAALVSEEAGELLREANNKNKSLSRHECYQTVAVAIRMLTHLEV